MSELDEKRAIRIGKITPLAVLQRAEKEVESGDVKNVILCILKADGSVEVGYSSGNLLEFIGLTEVLKNDLLHDVLQSMGD